ncbi:Ankyrin repeat and EF-hand domain-containing protein 1 [Smittium culicis]|uniref:Ankyrin repeat and EF-hand domain-containing protein 1 n=1 Tax=Smittium culicis TaxID=133412 RepID=A0A1R1YB93_9FUNG|nr:Ankyrin repeat and EF-hand domain-containing protein 1 [Smittium culicis]
MHAAPIPLPLSDNDSLANSETLPQSTELPSQSDSSNPNTQFDSPDSSFDPSEEILILTDQSLSIKEKKDKLNHLFRQAAISGDIQKLKRLWATWKPAGWLDINDKDQDGLSPLITASCFGKLDVVKFLIENGANVNQTDDFGWSALMWATNNNDENIVNYLIQNHASIDPKSVRGHTAMNIATTLLSSKPDNSNSSPNPPSPSINAISPISPTNSSPNASLKTSPQKTSASKKSIYRTSNIISLLNKKISIDLNDSTNNSPTESSDESSNIDPDNNSSPEKSTNAFIQFDWDTVLPDQMYALPQADISRFLQILTSSIEPKTCLATKSFEFTPANMIFLALRFTATLGAPDSLETFLYEAVASITHAIQTSRKNVSNLAFWQSNTHALCYFLCRDSNLRFRSSIVRERLSNLIIECYLLYLKITISEIDELLDEAFLDYIKNPEIFQGVEFEKEAKSNRLFNFFSSKTNNTADSSSVSISGKPLQRSKSTRIKPISRTASNFNKNSADKPKKTFESNRISYFFSKDPQNSSQSKSPNPINDSSLSSPSIRSSSSNKKSISFSKEDDQVLNPDSIISLISKFVSDLSVSYVHPNFLISSIDQLLKYMSEEMFNRVLTTKDFCCRSRALQIRLNLTVLEDWIHSKKFAKNNHVLQNTTILPNNKVFDPLIEILQLLQVISSLKNLNSFIEIIDGFTHVNMLHLNTIIKNYRYEVGETHILPQIICYVKPAATRIKDIQESLKNSYGNERFHNNITNLPDLYYNSFNPEKKISDDYKSQSNNSLKSSSDFSDLNNETIDIYTEPGHPLAKDELNSFPINSFTKPPSQDIDTSLRDQFSQELNLNHNFSSIKSRSNIKSNYHDQENTNQSSNPRRSFIDAHGRNRNSARSSTLSLSSIISRRPGNKTQQNQVTNSSLTNIKPQDKSSSFDLTANRDFLPNGSFDTGANQLNNLNSIDEEEHPSRHALNLNRVKDSKRPHSMQPVANPSYNLQRISNTFLDLDHSNHENSSDLTSFGISNYRQFPESRYSSTTRFNTSLTNYMNSFDENLANLTDLFDSQHISIPEIPNINDYLVFWKNLSNLTYLPVIVRINNLDDELNETETNKRESKETIKSVDTVNSSEVDTTVTKSDYGSHSIDCNAINNDLKSTDQVDILPTLTENSSLTNIDSKDTTDLSSNPDDANTSELKANLDDTTSPETHNPPSLSDTNTNASTDSLNKQFKTKLIAEIVDLIPIVNETFLYQLVDI